jgi:hypothetical protein
MKKQTAIEWLVEQVNADCLNSTFIKPELVEKAKEMEREQIILAHQGGNKESASHYRRYAATQYYNGQYHETFGVGLNDYIHSIPIETRLVNIIIRQYRMNQKDKKKLWSKPKITYLFKLTPEYVSRLKGVGVKQVEAFKEIVARLEVLREKKEADK